MATSLTIGGSSVSVPGTVIPRRLVAYVKGGVPSFTFQTRGGSLPGLPDPYLGKSVSLSINSTLYFTGDVVSAHPTFDPHFGWVTEYQCAGLRNRGDWCPHTDSNNLGDTSIYNASQDSQSLDYISGRAGRTVGQIIGDVLTMSANGAALNAVGIGAYTSTSPYTLPTATTTDLSALTLIPPTAVYFGGERLLSAVESLLAQWAPNVTLWVQPDGTLRFMDLRSTTNHTFTLETDPIRPTPLSRDVADCYTRVKVRGSQIAEMFLLSLSNGGLNENPFAHDGLTVAQAKAAWTSSDYQQPGLPSGQATGTASLTSGAVSGITPGQHGYGYPASSTVAVAFSGGGGSGAAAHGNTDASGTITSYTVTAGGSGYTSAPTVSVAAPRGGSSDSGTCSCTSTTTLSVTSTNASTSWSANYWDQSSTGKHGSVFLSYSAGSGITMFAQRNIVANGALTAGGSCSVTLDRALPHTNFDAYVITGQAGSANDVWRRYGVTDSTIAASLAQQSSYPFAYHLASGPAISLTSFPVGSVLWSSNGLPPYSEAATQCAVDSSNGTVVFTYPTYLEAGNQAPADVRALVPVYTDVNETVWPADVAGVPQYGGTAHSVEGIARTLTVTVAAWRDPANATAMNAYAHDLYDSVSNSVVEGVVEYLGLYEPALVMGLGLSVTGSSYTTGWESLNLPVVEAQLEWTVDGLNYNTSMRCSNRRAHYSAEAFLRPDRTGVSFDFGGTINFGSGVSLPGAGNPGGDAAAMAALATSGLGDMQGLASGALGGLQGLSGGGLAGLQGLAGGALGDMSSLATGGLADLAGLASPPPPPSFPFPPNQEG